MKNQSSKPCKEWVEVEITPNDLIGFTLAQVRAVHPNFQVISDDGRPRSVQQCVVPGRISVSVVKGIVDFAEFR